MLGKLAFPLLSLCAAVLAASSPSPNATTIDNDPLESNIAIGLAEDPDFITHVFLHTDPGTFDEKQESLVLDHHAHWLLRIKTFEQVTAQYYIRCLEFNPNIRYGESCDLSLFSPNPVLIEKVVSRMSKDKLSWFFNVPPGLLRREMVKKGKELNAFSLKSLVQAFRDFDMVAWYDDNSDFVEIFHDLLALLPQMAVPDRQDFDNLLGELVADFIGPNLQLKNSRLMSDDFGQFWRLFKIPMYPNYHVANSTQNLMALCSYFNYAVAASVEEAQRACVSLAAMVANNGGLIVHEFSRFNPALLANLSATQQSGEGITNVELFFVKSLCVARPRHRQAASKFIEYALNENWDDLEQLEVYKTLLLGQPIMEGDRAIQLIESSDDPLACVTILDKFLPSELQSSIAKCTLFPPGVIKFSDPELTVSPANPVRFFDLMTNGSLELYPIQRFLMGRHPDMNTDELASLTYVLNKAMTDLDADALFYLYVRYRIFGDQPQECHGKMPEMALFGDTSALSRSQKHALCSLFLNIGSFRHLSPQTTAGFKAFAKIMFPFHVTRLVKDISDCKTLNAESLILMHKKTSEIPMSWVIEQFVEQSDDVNNPRSFLRILQNSEAFTMFLDYVKELFQTIKMNEVSVADARKLIYKLAVWSRTFDAEKSKQILDIILQPSALNTAGYDNSIFAPNMQKAFEEYWEEILESNEGIEWIAPSLAFETRLKIMLRMFQDPERFSDEYVVKTLNAMFKDKKNVLKRIMELARLQESGLVMRRCLKVIIGDLKLSHHTVLPVDAKTWGLAIKDAPIGYFEVFKMDWLRKMCSENPDTYHLLVEYSLKVFQENQEDHRDYLTDYCKYLGAIGYDKARIASMIETLMGKQIPINVDTSPTLKLLVSGFFNDIVQCGPRFLFDDSSRQTMMTVLLCIPEGKPFKLKPVSLPSESSLHDLYVYAAVMSGRITDLVLVDDSDSIIMPSRRESASCLHFEKVRLIRNPSDPLYLTGVDQILEFYEKEKLELDIQQ